MPQGFHIQPSRKVPLTETGVPGGGQSVALLANALVAALEVPAVAVRTDPRHILALVYI